MADKKQAQETVEDLNEMMKVRRSKLDAYREMVYRTFFKPGSDDCYEGLDMLLGYPMQMIEKYGQSFLDACGLQFRDV